MTTADSASSRLPNFQEFMRPVLQILSDCATWSKADLRSRAFDALDIPADLREYRNENGNWIANGRVHWAVTYMAQAGLVDRVARGHVRINDRGLQFLKEHPQGVTAADLKDFPEFQEFMSRTGRRRGGESPESVVEAADSGDPHETARAVVESVNRAVASDVLQRLKEQSPLFLEQTIVHLMRSIGYGFSAESAMHIGGPGDEGFDGVIHQDALGLDRVYLQAKRWTGTSAVGRPEIQKFAGALQGARANRGIFITTGRFSQDARDYALNLPMRVALIDGQELADLMVTHRVGVDVRETLHIVQIDDEFFDR